ncbi:MAG: GNAT family N-acetyltransferase [Rhodobacteraceae bacterium]|nr:GNAT family N-acetyltransferase [Paracoccaceae bacterium]
MEIVVRPTQDEDVTGLCALLNEIIAIGGTTAILEPLSEEMFMAWALNGSRSVSCVTAADEEGTLLGFQTLKRAAAPKDDWGIIATFARTTPKVPGVGTKLFQATKEQALAAGLHAIDATIRADNVSGLSFYTKMGFQDHSVAKDVPLTEGVSVDRVTKVFWLGAGSGDQG